MPTMAQRKAVFIKAGLDSPLHCYRRSLPFFGRNAHAAQIANLQSQQMADRQQNASFNSNQSRGSPFDLGVDKEIFLFLMPLWSVSGLNLIYHAKLESSQWNWDHVSGPTHSLCGDVKAFCTGIARRQWSSHLFQHWPVLKVTVNANYGAKKSGFY